MKVLTKKADLRAYRRSLSAEVVGFVPTMGALHEGHMSLVRAAKQSCDRVIASIFVNPTQFDRDADLQSYPSDLEADQAKLVAEGCDALFTIAKDSMYEADFSTWVVPEGSLVAGLCGRTRGSHFRGVCTVVTKLLSLVQPDRAFFGQKDFQQLAIIQRMVRDLDLPVDIVSCPIVREADGLALSSRNQLLTAENRAAAVTISQLLARARDMFAKGERQPQVIKSMVREQLEVSARAIDYIEIVDRQSLVPCERLCEDSVMALAAFYGDVRLIDNHRLGDAFPSAL